VLVNLSGKEKAMGQPADQRARQSHAIAPGRGCANCPATLLCNRAIPCS